MKNIIIAILASTLFLIVAVIVYGIFFYKSSDHPARFEILVGPKEKKEIEVYEHVPYEETYDPKTDGINTNEKRDLTMSYELKVVGTFPQVTVEVARDLCSIIVRSGVCAWGTTLVNESGSLEQKISEQQFQVSISPDVNPMEFGLQYHINIVDPGAYSPNYRMFVVHKDLLERVNGIYEAHITAETAPQGSARVFEWYLQEKHIDESGAEIRKDLPEGHYEIVVVDTATGRISGFTKRFRIGSGPKYSSDTVEYAANTPLAHSYWSGKGVFFDGGGGEDTINLVGTMGMYDIFKGIDFPERGHTQTFIFIQAGSVVITVVNVENIGFDDKSLTSQELITILNANGGELYRIEKFDPEGY
jgi:hypothetical protein